MEIQEQVVHQLAAGASTGELGLTVVFREINDEDGHYWVAECVEIPGCVSQGDSQPEAQHNIRDAIQGCLQIMLEDAVAEAFRRRLGTMSYTGISSQERLIVRSRPELQMEYA